MIRAKAPRHRRLLIADDSDAIRWLIRSTLECEFAEVIEIVHGRDLYCVLLDDDDVVILTDACVHAGPQFLDAWRALHPTVPTLLVAAHPDEAIRARARALAIPLLETPFSAARLRAVTSQLAGATKA